MIIRKLNINETPPMNLLLLADPSLEHVQEYIQRGECFIAEKENQIIGVYILLRTRPATVELVNIAVDEKEQGLGIGKWLVMDAIKKQGLQDMKSSKSEQEIQVLVSSLYTKNAASE